MIGAALFLLCCACVRGEALGGARRPLMRTPRGVEGTGSYMVVLHKDATEKKLKETTAAVSKLADKRKVYTQVHTVSKAFTVKLSPFSLELVRRLPDVDYIEEESYAHGDQLPEWHLDRLDQLRPELDHTYQPIGDGTGVDVYILDSGIDYHHTEFEYRAKYVGRDPFDEYNIANEYSDRKLQRGADCHGHGTHVASLCGGKTYGSAKNVRLFSVRVLGCTNTAPWSVVIAGLDIVADRVMKTNRPSVVSMSLSGGRNMAMDDAVAKVIQQGIHVVVAAGNGGKNACASSPANSRLVVTVGGTRRGDGLYLLGSGSNFGPCVDVLAPGERVRAADWRCANCSIPFSGTSMSTPLVSGLVAIKLSRRPLTTPADMRNELINESLKNVINFEGIPSNFRLTTPNRLVTIPGSCGFQSFVDGSGSFSSPNFPGLYPVNLDCRWEIGGNSYVRVVATISFVELERFYDKLFVYDGCCGEETKIIGNMTGSLRFVNRTYNSTGNLLCIRLITDGTVSGRGFNGTYINYYRGTDLKVPTAPRPVVATGIADVQSHLLVPPRQARSDMSNLMKAGYKLTWISSYRVGPDMIPYFDYVATNDSTVDTAAFVEISFAELNETIHVMEQRKYYVSLLIDRIRGKNPLEPSYSVIFTRRDEIFETKVYLRDTLTRYKLRLARKFRNGYRLLSQSFCSIRGSIEVSSVFIRDRRIPFNIPTPQYPQWRALVNLTFFQFTDETLKEARRNFIPVAVEVYKLDGITQSLFSVVYEERTDRTQGNWFRWSLNSTAARTVIKETIARSWDVFITTAYTYLGATEHFIEFTRKQFFYDYFF